MEWLLNFPRKFQIIYILYFVFLQIIHYLIEKEVANKMSYQDHMLNIKSYKNT